MKLYLALIVFFAIGLFIAPNVFADSTRTQNFDGIDGWSCYTDGVFSCNGPNKYPITVKQSDTEGRPTPSLLVSGDPPTNTHACAEKFITSDWDIESVEISLDVYGHITPRNHPVVEIGVDKYDISGPSFEWISFEKTQNVNPAQKNSVPIRLCITDSNKATEPRAAYFDNIIIKTNEVNPDWIAEEEAKRDAEEKEAAEAEKAKQAAEAKQKAAEQAAAAAAEQQRIAEETAAAKQAELDAAEEKEKADAEAAQAEIKRNEVEQYQQMARQGLDLINEGNYDEALNILNQVTSLDPVNAEAYYYKGWVYNEKNMYAEALTNYNKASIFLPDNHFILHEIGKVNYNLKNYFESLEYFEKSLEVSPTYGESQLWLKLVQEEIKKQEAFEAEEAARIAAEQAAAEEAARIAAADAAEQQIIAEEKAAAEAARIAAEQAAAEEAARIAAEAERVASDILVTVDPTIVPPPPPVAPVDVTPDNTEIFDTPSNSVQVETSNNDFIFTKTWKNDNQFGSQQFAYILQIKDENDIVVSISYVSGMLGPKQTFEQSLSFDPGLHGSYLATAYVWDDLINQNVLDNPESVLIQVTPEKTSNLSSTNDWLEDFMP